jgi:hypothetical protein
MSYVRIDACAEESNAKPVNFQRGPDAVPTLSKFLVMCHQQSGAKVTLHNPRPAKSNRGLFVCFIVEQELNGGVRRPISLEQ